MREGVVTSQRAWLMAGVFLLLAGVLLLWFSQPAGIRIVHEKPERRTGQPPPPSPVTFHWNLEGAPRMSIRQVGPDHYACSFPDKVNFFLFQVEGAAGRTIQFTFTGIPSDHWSAIRPVVGYGTDLSDPAFFEPDSKGQSKWQFMQDCHVDDPQNITYTWHFTQNAAYVALRVPYTLEYQQRYLAGLPKQKGLEIITIGQSAEGRPLTLIKISRGDEQAEKENPCILMYAREHCDEPDSSWAVQGALRFLVSNAPEAQQMRQKFTFLLIPMLDPDGWARGVHEGIVSDFRESGKPSDALKYALWAKQWFDSGRRFDVVLNLHNPEPGYYSQVLCPRIEPGVERLAWGHALLTDIWAGLGEVGLSPRPKPLSFGMSPGRLGNYLSLCYGTLHLPLEINEQNAKRRLFLADMKTLGQGVLTGACRYLDSLESHGLLTEIADIRSRRSSLADSAKHDANKKVMRVELRHARKPVLSRLTIDDVRINRTVGGLSRVEPACDYSRTESQAR